MRSFEDDVKRLEQDPEAVLQEVEQWREEVIGWVQNVLREAERGMDGTQDVDLRVMGDSDFSPAVKMVAFSLAIKAYEDDWKPRYRFQGELAEAVGKFMNDTELFDIPAGRQSSKRREGIYALLWSQKLLISVYVLPEQIREDLDFGRMPPVLEPLFDTVVDEDSNPTRTPQMERFKSLLNHEMTHAYIQDRLGNSWRRSYERLDKRLSGDGEVDLRIKSIDEAAAQAVSSITYPSRTTGIENYQTQIRHSMADLQFFKTCFMIYARRFGSKEEAVSEVRARAVTAIRRIKRTIRLEAMERDLTKLPLIKKYQLTEAILGEEDRQLERFHKVLESLEDAEKRMFYSLVLLNIIDHDWDNHMDHYSSEIKSEADNTIEEFVDSEGVMTELIPEKSEKQVFDPDRGEYGEYIEKHEFEDSLYEIREGLQKLLAIAEKDNSLNEKERSKLKDAVSDVEEAIDIYRQENKIEHAVGEELEEEFEADTGKIADWIRERVEKGEYTDPVRVLSDLEVETEAIVKDYERMAETGLEYNRKIKQRLEALHHDEEGIHKILERHNIQDEQVEEMMTITKHIYQLSEKSIQRFEEAQQEIQEAHRQLESM